MKEGGKSRVEIKRKRYCISLNPLFYKKSAKYAMKHDISHSELLEACTRIIMENDLLEEYARKYLRRSKGSYEPPSQGNT